MTDVEILIKAPLKFKSVLLQSLRSILTAPLVVFVNEIIIFKTNGIFTAFTSKDFSELLLPKSGLECFFQKKSTSDIAIAVKTASKVANEEILLFKIFTFRSPRNLFCVIFFLRSRPHRNKTALTTSIAFSARLFHSIITAMLTTELQF